MIKINTFCPIFPGFYGTIFEPNEEEQEIDHINEIRQEKGFEPLEFDHFEFDYNSYMKEVSQNFCEFIERELKHILGKNIEVNFQSIYSPKEYNFSNDSINCEIVLNKTILAKIKKYLKKNKQDFEEYLKKFKSCSGFISFYDHYFDTWIGEYFDNIGNNPVFLGSILDFILANKGIEEINALDWVRAPLFCTNYDNLINNNDPGS